MALIGFKLACEPIFPCLACVNYLCLVLFVSILYVSGCVLVFFSILCHFSWPEKFLRKVDVSVVIDGSKNEISRVALCSRVRAGM